MCAPKAAIEPPESCSLPPLTLDQLRPVYEEAIASSDTRVVHIALRLIWRRLEQTLEDRR
jgi:hypothetical protein